MSPTTSLRVVKIVHTIVWAFFAGCIVALPIMGYLGRYRQAVELVGVVLVECVILVVNRWNCPLTAVAGRFTDNREDNFDIYLPIWLARHNKTIFGLLFIGGICFTLCRWLGWLE